VRVVLDRRFEEAEAAYKKALEIYIGFDDRYEQADTYHQLWPIADMRPIVAAIDDRPRHSGGGCTLRKQTLRPAAVASEMGRNPTFSAMVAHLR
jgi:hypothetical protein